VVDLEQRAEESEKTGRKGEKGEEEKGGEDEAANI